MLKTEDGNYRSYEVVAIRSSNASYKLFCYNSNLCQKLNRKLKQYDYTFQDGDEAIFKLTENEYRTVQKILLPYKII